MITHNNLLTLIKRSNEKFSCPDGEIEGCSNNFRCMECAKKLLTEYEESIRAEERRKFAEWICKNNVGIVDFYNDEWKIEMIYKGADYAIEEYEKEVTKNE